MTKITEVINFLEQLAPPALQEDYDNSGLLVGNPDREVTGVLITLDTTEDIVEEAIQSKCNLIISHHPIIFRGVKRLVGNNYVERTVINAIKNDIAIYAIHTNLDNVLEGVNHKIAQRVGLADVRILAPKQGTQSKLVTFIPKENTEQVLDELHQVGAGVIGNYDHCSFRISGTGRYRPNEKANPHIGSPSQMETTSEDRVEVVFPNHLRNTLVNQLRRAHPYEEVAFYIHPVINADQSIGSGMIGSLAEPMTGEDFLKHLKSSMDLDCIRHTEHIEHPISTVAICGGSGSFLLKTAISSGADAFVTADFKYHEFFDAEGRILIADIGHYESEAFTKDLLAELLSENFTTFALNLSKRSTNPVRYF